MQHVATALRVMCKKLRGEGLTCDSVDPWGIIEGRPLDLRDGVHLRRDSPSLYATANLVWTRLRQGCDNTPGCERGPHARGSVANG